MMTCLDPFYGISRFGRWTAKLFNRILVLTELAAIFYFAWLEYIHRYHSYWIYLAYFPLALIGVSFLNRILRDLWNMVEVLIYGTNDQEELRRIQQKGRIKDAERQARRDYRKMKKQEVRQQRLALKQQAEQLKLERRNATLLPDRKETDPLAIYAEAAAKATTVSEIPKPQNKQELLIHDDRAIELMRQERLRLWDPKAPHPSHSFHFEK